SSGTTGNFNVWASTETSLKLHFNTWSGLRGGESYDREDNNTDKVTWTNPCQNITSQGSGNWTNTTTWNPGIVPTSCSYVTIRTGDTVTVDDTDIRASTTTVTGTLKFLDTGGSSMLMIVTGSMTVTSGGSLVLGTSNNPIPDGSTATLVLAYGSTA